MGDTMKLIEATFKPAKNKVIEGIEDTVPFILSIKGVHSASPPVAFLIMIDVSYSMDGEKIFRAKQAALKILELIRDKDYVGVYGFCGKVKEVLKPIPFTDKKLVEKAIVSLKLDSGTNIYESLKVLAEQARKLVESKAVSAVRAIFITDGEPTSGPKKPKKILEMARKLREAGGTALVIGVGEKYNEKLLLDIARAVNGVFEHAHDPEALEKTMYEYTSIVRELCAREIVATLVSSPYTRVNIYNRESITIDNETRVNIGDIHYGEVIDVVGELLVEPMVSGTHEALTITISYINPETDEQEFLRPIRFSLNIIERGRAGEIMVDNTVEAEVRAVKAALTLSENVGKKPKKEEIEKQFEELVEATRVLGSKNLVTRTMSIKEMLSEEGFTPDVTKEMASIISKILSGRIEKEKKEEGDKK